MPLRKQKTVYDVADHIEANHIPTFPGYKCVKCPPELAGRLLFRVHIENVHCSFSASEFQCEHCVFSFTSKYGLTDHMKDNHSEYDIQVIIVRTSSDFGGN